MASSESDVGAVAMRFAGHLDARRFSEARALVGADCTYTHQGRVLVGPAAILGSYQSNDQRGASVIEVEYRSALLEVRGDKATVEFIDEIRCGDRFHVFVSAQELRITEGRIRRIVGLEDPARRERLEAFLKGCGVE